MCGYGGVRDCLLFSPELRGQTKTNSLARSLIVVVARGANGICYCCPHSEVCSCFGGCRLRLVGVPAHASGHSNFDLTLSEAEFAVAFAAILNCVTIYPPPPIKPSRSQRTSPQQPVTRRPEQ